MPHIAWTDEGFRVCVRTHSLKGTGFSPYIYSVKLNGLYRSRRGHLLVLDAQAVPSAAKQAAEKRTLGKRTLVGTFACRSGDC